MQPLCSAPQDKSSTSQSSRLPEFLHGDLTASQSPSSSPESEPRVGSVPRGILAAPGKPLKSAPSAAGFSAGILSASLSASAASCPGLGTRWRAAAVFYFEIIQIRTQFSGCKSEEQTAARFPVVLSKNRVVIRTFFWSSWPDVHPDKSDCSSLQSCFWLYKVKFI